MRNIDNERHSLQMAAIQEAVADAFGLTSRDLMQISKTRGVAMPRQMAMYLVSQLTDASVLEIGRAFESHHMTVVHAIAKIGAMRRTNSEVDVMINNIFSVIASE